MMKRSGKMYDPDMDSGPAKKIRTDRDDEVSGAEPSMKGMLGSGSDADPMTKNTMESGAGTPSDHCKNTVGHAYD